MHLSTYDRWKLSTPWDDEGAHCPVCDEILEGQDEQPDEDGYVAEPYCPSCDVEDDDDAS